MITFLITFLLMLISGSIFTLGVYTITRGQIKILPDGKEIEEKEIFGSWEIFWMQIICYEKVFYYGAQLEQKLKILEQLKPAYMGIISFSTTDKKSLFFSSAPTDAEIRDIEWVLNCRIFKSDEVIFLYDEYPVYRFPEWVRKITNCYVCFSGWGGTFIYWALLFHYQNIFQLSANPSVTKFIFWIIYCVSLAFINKSVKEFFDNEKK